MPSYLGGQWTVDVDVGIGRQHTHRPHTRAHSLTAEIYSVTVVDRRMNDAGQRLALLIDNDTNWQRLVHG